MTLSQLASLLADLRLLARRVEDDARALSAEAAAFRPEYDALLAERAIDGQPDAEKRRRAAEELYPRVVLAERDADALRANAEVLRGAADLIARWHGALRAVAAINEGPDRCLEIAAIAGEALR